jgi:hypothetical protein
MREITRRKIMMNKIRREDIRITQIRKKAIMMNENRREGIIYLHI